MSRKRAAIFFPPAPALYKIVGFSCLLLSIATSWPAAGAVQVVLLTGSEEKSADVAELETQLVAAVRAQLQELDVHLIVFPAAAQALALNTRRAREVGLANGAVGVIWIEPGATSLDVYLYEVGGDHLYVRRVPTTHSAEASSEEVAIMLRSAVGAMLYGSSISMTEVAVPEPAPVAPAPSAPPAEVSSRVPEPARADAGIVRIGASYVGTLFSREASFQHGVGLAAGLHVPGSPWFLGLAYTYFPPLELIGAGVRTRVRRHPAELYGGAEFEWQRLWFVAEAAVVADNVERTTETAGQGLSEAAPSSRWLWALSTRLGGAVTLAGNLRCTAKIGAEFLLNPYDQVIAGAAGDQVVASPMPARPRAEIGVSIGF